MIAAPVASAPAHWMPEKDVTHCLECHLPFNSLLRRKHHCRICGKVVCYACCQHSVADPARPSTAKLRACNSCYLRSMVGNADGLPHLNVAPSTAPPSPRGIAATPSIPTIEHFTSDPLPLETPTVDALHFTSGPSPSNPASSGKHSAVHHGRSLTGPSPPSPRPASPSPSPDPHHPAPLPVFTANDPVSNTVASVTAMFAPEEVMQGSDHHHPTAHRASLPLSLETHQGITHPSNLRIVVPPKALDAPTEVTIVPATSSEPVSPSKALENHLRRHGTPGLSPRVPSPVPPGSPMPAGSRSGGSSPAVPVSPATPGGEEEQVVLDLSMKLCLVILKKTAFEMKARYHKYLKTKALREEEEPLSFQQFMFFSTIRTLPDFLFKKTDLAFGMMRLEGSQIVLRESFVRYAPVLPPLASKLDAGAVFDVLATDLPDGAGGMVKGISLALFKQYVENLHKEFHPEHSRQWDGWREEFDLPKSEHLLGVRHNVTDTTHFPPHMGTVGLTNHHLIYSSVFKKRRCIHWLDIVKVEKNEEGFLRRNEHAGIRLHFFRESKEEKEEKTHTQSHTTHGTPLPAHSATHNNHQHRTPYHHGHLHAADVSFHKRRFSTEPDADERGPIKIIHWDVPGISSDALHAKQRFFLHLRVMHASHHLAYELTRTQPMISAALLQETFDLVRRMKALESIAAHVDPLKLNPYGDFSETAEQEWIRRIREVVKHTERVKASKKSWLTNLLPGLGGAAESKGAKVEDIDPEFRPVYKSMEEMNADVKAAEPFSVKAFSYNVKLFSRQLQPVIALWSFINKVRNWDNPLLTASLVAFLLNLCYRDYLCYIPAMLILFNIIALVVFYINPDALTEYLDRVEREKEAEAQVEEESSTGSAPVIISTVGPPGNISPGMPAGVPVATAVTVVRKKEERKEATPKQEPVGLLAKLKEYRDVAVKTKDHLETVQHGLGEVNLKTMRVDGLYKWSSPWTTGKFMAILCVLFLVLIIVPFRFVFPIILIDWVTDKWQKQGSILDRLLQEVPLPERMPEID